MGCCESCLGKTDDEPNERTSLLGPSGNAIPVNAANPISTPYDPTPVGSIANSKFDEQSMFNGIITQYNNEVIDITSMDSKIDAVEYMNRVQLYNRKVASLTSGSRYKQQPLHSSGNNPANVLRCDTVGIDDIALV
uniref:Ragulator complex protein LAMTOR1 n=1 Tax=Ciona savignyi TaxID=51511 RepID=H2YW32_CIOSA